MTDIVVGLSRAARLLGHVQYFKHYRKLPPLYRDGPNPGENFDLMKKRHINTFLLVKILLCIRIMYIENSSSEVLVFPWYNSNLYIMILAKVINKNVT